jgi:hypothetical protein
VCPLRWPRVSGPGRQYNLNLQTEVMPDLLFEIACVGAKSTHVPGCAEFNKTFFNALNHPEFRNPMTDHPTGPAFGLITSTVANSAANQFALGHQF